MPKLDVEITYDLLSARDFIDKAQLRLGSRRDNADSIELWDELGRVYRTIDSILDELEQGDYQ